MRDARLVVKAMILGGSTIAIILAGLTTLALALVGGIGLSPSLGASALSRLVGIVLLVGGTGLALWLFTCRSPFDMIVSTYLTFVKMFTRKPIASTKGRSEPLVVNGPQRFVRHPLYLSVTTIFFGWGLFNDSTGGVLGALFVLLWLLLVQIPFEERELRALFGEQFTRYASQVPSLIPLSNRLRSRR